MMREKTVFLMIMIIFPDRKPQIPDFPNLERLPNPVTEGQIDRQNDRQTDRQMLMIAILHGPKGLRGKKNLFLFNLKIAKCKLMKFVDTQTLRYIVAKCDIRCLSESLVKHFSYISLQVVRKRLTIMNSHENLMIIQK